MSSLPQTRVGLLVIGYAGSTASSLLGTIALLRMGVLQWPKIPSSLPVTWDSTAGLARDFVYGGWDFTDAPLLEILAAHDLIPRGLRDQIPAAGVEPVRLRAVATRLDFRYTDTADDWSDMDVGHAASAVGEEIAAFRQEQRCDQLIVLYLGSPARPASPALSEVSRWSDLLARPTNTVPANLLYAVAALVAGAHFVDFTPSEALTCPAVLARSFEARLQLAGRDGSTGQTMMKAAVASMMLARGFRLRSWFSSNHLGNHDGLVLADQEFAWLKMADKKRFLSERIPDSEFDHVVSIDFLRSKGDRKESFDSVVAEDIFGQEIRVRINWEAWDSALAVPMLLDLIRLISLGDHFGFHGVQGQLGFFFKSPIGSACESPEYGHRQLIEYYGRAIDQFLTR
jgi:myo-inositol-1-phosphate synthase